MTLYHGEAGKLVIGNFLDHDECETMRYELSDSERALKREMLSEFASQQAVLAAFKSWYEQFRIALRHDFPAPPRQGSHYCEQLGWPLSGAQWRSYACAATTYLESTSKRGVLCH